MSLTKGVGAEEDENNSNIKSQTPRTNTDAQNTDAQTLELILADADLLLCGTDLRSLSVRNLLVTSFSTLQLNDAFGRLEGIQQDIVIMILNYVFQSFSNKLKAISRIPLDSFTESENILIFIEAVIKSTLRGV